MSAAELQINGGAPDDAAIVASVLAGEIALYEVLMRRHNQKVYRAVRSVLGDDAETEDVMQQAYLAAFAHLAQFRASARFSTWLVRIAVNEALARVRRRQRFVPLEVAADESASDPFPWEEPAVKRSSDPESQAQARELGRTLEALIDELPAHHRAVFVLRELEGLSTRDVAHVLDISEDNVKARLHRAKSGLQARLTQRLGEAAVEAWRFDGGRCDRVVEAVMASLGSDPGRG